jgi:hypothetical protein
MANLKKDELAAIARVLGISSTGTVPELVIKVRHYLVTNNMVQPASAEGALRRTGRTAIIRLAV